MRVSHRVQQRDLADAVHGALDVQHVTDVVRVRAEQEQRRFKYVPAHDTGRIRNGTMIVQSRACIHGIAPFQDAISRKHQRHNALKQ
jgi:hypothetical protein